LPVRVLRPRGFPVVKSRLSELGNLTHSEFTYFRVPNREDIGKDRLKGWSIPVVVMVGGSGE
jgi:hypothetical protein